MAADERAARAARRAQQLRDIFGVKSFPVASWMLAGSCLFVLYLVDMPNRARQRKEWAEAAKQSQSSEKVVQELSGGRVLLDDGSVRKQQRGS